MSVFVDPAPHIAHHAVGRFADPRAALVNVEAPRVQPWLVAVHKIMVETLTANGRSVHMFTRLLFLAIVSVVFSRKRLCSSCVLCPSYVVITGLIG